MIQLTRVPGPPLATRSPRSALGCYRLLRFMHVRALPPPSPSSLSGVTGRSGHRHDLSTTTITSTTVTVQPATAMTIIHLHPIASSGGGDTMTVATPPSFKAASFVLKHPTGPSVFVRDSNRRKDENLGSLVLLLLAAPPHVGTPLPPPIRRGGVVASRGGASTPGGGTMLEDGGGMHSRARGSPSPERVGSRASRSPVVVERQATCLLSASRRGGVRRSISDIVPRRGPSAGGLVRWTHNGRRITVRRAQDPESSHRDATPRAILDSVSQSTVPGPSVASLSNLARLGDDRNPPDATRQVWALPSSSISGTPINHAHCGTYRIQESQLVETGGARNSSTRGPAPSGIRPIMNGAPR